MASPARATPVRQMGSDQACTPATKVPSVSSISSTMPTESSFSTARMVSLRTIIMAPTKASQCSAWVTSSRIRLPRSRAPAQPCQTQTPK